MIKNKSEVTRKDVNCNINYYQLTQMSAMLIQNSLLQM